MSQEVPTLLINGERLLDFPRPLPIHISFSGQLGAAKGTVCSCDHPSFFRRKGQAHNRRGGGHSEAAFERSHRLLSGNCLQHDQHAGTDDRGSIRDKAVRLVEVVRRSLRAPVRIHDTLEDGEGRAGSREAIPRPPAQVAATEGNHEYPIPSYCSKDSIQNWRRRS